MALLHFGAALLHPFGFGGLFTLLQGFVIFLHLAMALFHFFALLFGFGPAQLDPFRFVLGPLLLLRLKTFFHLGAALFHIVPALLHPFRLGGLLTLMQGLMIFLHLGMTLLHFRAILLGFGPAQFDPFGFFLRLPGKRRAVGHSAIGSAAVMHAIGEGVATHSHLRVGISHLSGGHGSVIHHRVKTNRRKATGSTAE